jgi:hypothetical protein
VAYLTADDEAVVYALKDEDAFTSGAPFLCLPVSLIVLPATGLTACYRPCSLGRGGEWGLVAPAVFKTVVSARKRRRVGSIPTRLRQARQTGLFIHGTRRLLVN